MPKLANGANTNNNNTELDDGLDLNEEPTTQTNKIFINKNFLSKFNNLSVTSLSSEQQLILSQFQTWNKNEQRKVLLELFKTVSWEETSFFAEMLTTNLKRDFIFGWHGMPHITRNVFSHLGFEDLKNSENVSRYWKFVIEEENVWMHFCRRQVRDDSRWRTAAKRRGWLQDILCEQKHDNNIDFRALVTMLHSDIEISEENWRNGNYKLLRTECQNNEPLGVYSFQCDDAKIISGNRDHTVKVWDRPTMTLKSELKGHTGSVLCVQFTDHIIVSGSSDSSIRIWDLHTGEFIKSIEHHREPVLRVRLEKNVLVVCSKDKTLSVWDLKDKCDFVMRGVLDGHRAAVNVVDFDERYVVSGSGDRVIKVWRTNTCAWSFDLQGHKRGVACLQYRFPLIVSGGSDNEIRIWDIETTSCMRTLNGHTGLVRCLRFNDLHLVSGDYNGFIKIWDMGKVLNTRIPEEEVVRLTVQKHESRIFHVVLEDFTIVTSGHDDSIITWDFFNDNPRSLPVKALKMSNYNGNSVVDDNCASASAAAALNAYDSGVENFLS